MSLIAKIAEKVVSTVSNEVQPMLISENPNLISRPEVILEPNLISPAPAFLPALSLQLFIGIAVAAGIIVALWRYNKTRGQL